MSKFHFDKKHLSQLPAIQLLVQLGFIYISPDDALKERGNRKSKTVHYTTKNRHE